MRRTVEYTLPKHKGNEDITNSQVIAFIEYRKDQKEQINTMSSDRFLKKVLKYQPKEKFG
jgi:polyhydroxyalkanoate synthesis regulator protein